MDNKKIIKDLLDTYWCIRCLKDQAEDAISGKHRPLKRAAELLGQYARREQDSLEITRKNYGQ